MFGEPKFLQPSVIENESEESPDKLLERAREFGEQYAGIIDVAIGKRTADSLLLTPLVKENKILFTAMQSFRQKQSELQNERNLDAQGLLYQAFQSEEQRHLLEDTTRYRLEELSSGIYSVMIDPNLFSKLMSGAEALAVKIPGGVSFIIIPNFQSHPEFQKRIIEENVPHETHHLVWDAAIDSGAFQSGEVDTDFRKGFMMFQDELIARASSDGGLGGYSHITLLGPQAREDLEKASPGKADAILDRVGLLNEFLYELNTVIMKSEKVTKKDLLQVIVTSKTFGELEVGLRKMKLLIEKFPFKEDAKPEKVGGFDAPIT